MSRPTMRDVAALAGTSTAVVSYVVNDGPRPVAPETRERVRDAIRQLGYRPDPVARALRARTTDTIGLLLPDIQAPFFAELAAGIEGACRDQGHRLLLATSRFDEAQEAEQLEALIDAKVGGLLIAPVAGADRLAERARGAGVPHLVLLRHDQPTVVGADDFEAGAAAVRHLVDSHGHRTIACLTSGPPGSPVHVRTSGFEEAMAELTGLTGPVDLTGLVRHCDYHELRQVAYAESRRLLADREDVTALVAMTDQHALGAIRAAAELGRRVPHDLAVVSIDGTSITEFVTPALTVLRVPFAEIGLAAVAQLVATGGPPEEAVRLRMQLIPRASCGCGGPTVPT